MCNLLAFAKSGARCYTPGQMACITRGGTEADGADVFTTLTLGACVDRPTIIRPLLLYRVAQQQEQQLAPQGTLPPLRHTVQAEGLL